MHLRHILDSVMLMPKSDRLAALVGGLRLQLVVLRAGELLVRDVPVLVFVLVSEDLFDQLVLVSHHLRQNVVKVRV